MAFSTFHSKILMFQSDENAQKQTQHVRQPYHGILNMQKLSGHDSGYGLPAEGSKTEFRGKQAGVNISKEIVELCGVIKEIGEKQPDGSYAVLFGDLFEIYTKISNKLVGMLMRARKQGLVSFEGEMLFQRKDDHVPIFLVKTADQLVEDLEKRKLELQNHPSK